MQIANGPRIDETIPADPEHIVVDVRQDDPAFTTHQLGKLGRQIPGTACDVQYGLARAYRAQFDGEAFPEAMDAS